MLVLWALHRLSLLSGLFPDGGPTINGVRQFTKLKMTVQWDKPEEDLFVKLSSSLEAD